MCSKPKVPPAPKPSTIPEPAKLPDAGLTQDQRNRARERLVSGGIASTKKVPAGANLGVANTGSTALGG